MNIAKCVDYVWRETTNNIIPKNSGFKLIRNIIIQFSLRPSIIYYFYFSTFIHFFFFEFKQI